MSLVCLPQEIVLIIIESFSERDLNSLVRVCRHFYSSLNSVLYRNGQHAGNAHRPGFSENQPAIFRAARKGNIGAVRKFVMEFGIDVNVPLPGSMVTLLHRAASFRHPPLVKFLLENGASISTKDQPKTTALQRGVQNDDIETVKHMLEHGPDPSDLVGAVGQISHHPVTAQIMVLLRTHILETYQQEFRYTPGSEVAMYRLLLNAVGTGDKDGVQALLYWGVPADFLSHNKCHRSTLVYWKEGRYVSIGNDYISTDNLVISSLFYAVLAGELGIARLLHSYGADLDHEGLSLPVLFAAIWTGNPAAMKLMVEWDADFLAKTNRKGTTALHIAAGEDIWDSRWPKFSPSVKIMKRLIRLGVPIGLPDNTGATALHIAVKNRWAAGVRCLLENWPDVNSLSLHSPTTPLYLAVSQGLSDILSILLEYNADVSTAVNNGLTPLMCVVRTVADARLLLEKGCDITARDEDGAIGLDYAVGKGDLGLVRFFLDHGAPVHQFAKNGFQPLHIASRSSDIPDRIAIAQHLLEHGAPVNTRCRGDVTPLHYVLNTKDSELVKLLLENGADVHSYDETGRTDLHHAVSGEPPYMLPILLDYVVDIDQTTMYDETPLHLAVIENNTALVWMLLDRGADVNMRTFDGETALFLAGPEIVSYLLDYGANPRDRLAGNLTMLHYATASSMHKVVSLLLQHMDFVDDRTQDGETALHIAAKSNRRKTIAVLLVEAGASLDAVNNHGETPLQVAQRLDLLEMVWVLEFARDRHIRSSMGASHMPEA